MTIVEFLLARIAEDEELARAADGNAWEQDDRSTRRNVVLPRGGFDWVGVAGERLDMPVLTAQVSNTARALFEARAEHIARHHPARVLAECQAKRAIIESVAALTGDREKSYLERLAHTEVEDARYGVTRDILRLLAAVYADHPDYDAAWRVA